jgi:hypothetical protein
MKKFVLFFCLVLFVNLNIKAVDGLEKYQTNFIFNFTRQIQWPNLHSQPEFVIAVFGKNHPLTRELMQSAAERNVGGRKIKIVEFNSIEQLGFCHLLFIPESKTNQVKRISDSLSDSPVVIVTETSGHFPAESILNLSVVNDKMGFAVNEESAKKRGLMLSTQLINYSRK